MNISNLEYFVQVADLRNFTQVAKNNHISQTAVSSQIAKLESELGSKLFDRSSLPIELTEIGNKIYPRVREILRQHNLIKRDIEDYKFDQRVVHFIYPEGFLKPLESIVIPATNIFNDVYFDINKIGLNSVQSEILRGSADIAICFESDVSDEAEIQTKSFMHGNFDLLVGEDNELRNKKEIEAQQLCDQKIVYVQEKVNSNLYRQMKLNAKNDKTPLNVVSVVNDIDTALILVRMNRGSLFVPEYNKLETEFSDLHRVKIKGTQHQYNVCLAWNVNNQNARKIGSMLSENIIKQLWGTQN